MGSLLSKILYETPNSNWSDLPIELLEKIVSNLTDISDIARFRSVCTRWRSTPTILLQRFPWLLVRYSDHHHLFTSSENKLYNTRLPHHLPSNLIMGSSFGYLLIVNTDRSIITLLNPFTGSHIRLPSLKSKQIPNCSTSCQGKLVKSDSSVHGFYVVISLQPHSTSPSFFCCRPEDRVWRRIHDSGYDNDANFFLVKVGGGVKSVVAPMDPRYEYSRRIPSDSLFGRTYLVETLSGELLKVVNNRSWTRIQRFLHVYKLDACNERRWVKVDSIGDNVLFVDFHNAVCLPASGFDGCEGNHVYLCDLDGVCLYDIGAERVKPLPSNWGNFPRGRTGGGAWIVPSL